MTYTLTKHPDYHNSTPLGIEFKTLTEARNRAKEELSNMEVKYGCRVTIYKNTRYLETIWECSQG